MTSKKWQLSFRRNSTVAYIWSKGSKIGHFEWFLESFVIFFSSKQSQRRIIVICDFPFQISCQTKFQVLIRCPKCSWDQTVENSWNSNISRISRVWTWSFVSESQIHWSWSGMARYIDKYGQVSSIYWIPLNRESYEIIVVRLFLTASVGQFNIFHRSCWLVFLWFFNDVTLFLHLRNRQSNVRIIFAFVFIWTKRALK